MSEKMTLHSKISYIKSVLRIIGYVALFFSVPVGAVILIVAEGLGIAEEAWPNAYAGTETVSEK